MPQKIRLALSPEQASSDKYIKKKIAAELKISSEKINNIHIVKKSIDARSKYIKIIMEFDVFFNNEVAFNKPIDITYKNVTNKQEVIVVGAGPAGLFAALRLIERGIKPIILERGKDVISRKRDIGNINSKHIVDGESNYCFGEGGAGTFSDGKLYTRSKKRGNVQRILEVFKFHGAYDAISYEAHPHIGTDKLHKIIKHIRETIINAGGEIHFNTKVEDIDIKDDRIKQIITAKGDKIDADYVILATGHSARDIYTLLHKKGVYLEQKDFAMGVRVEHPQALIDSIQYSCKVRSKYLPAAAYNLVSRIGNRGVYSFCMCPGGSIVPSATADNQVVVNGMSASNRNSPFANSGIVVEIKQEDCAEFAEHGALAGMMYQQKLEEMAFQNGGNGQTAPAQRLHDFVNKKISANLPETSYRPGVISSPLHFWLPEIISNSLRAGFANFGKKMNGYLTNEAIVLGVESRSSSPVRIPRDREKLHHVQIKNLYPVGEGAGYSGGIVSSAIDGENSAENIAHIINKFN